MIQDKVNEVEDYFKYKLITGNYEFISAGEHTAIIKIDGFKFFLWIHEDSTPKDKFNFHYYEDSLIVKPSLKTQKERIEAYEIFKPVLDNYKKTELIEQKKAQIERLQAELKSYE